MADDFDAELLALAGDDSDEETSPQAKQSATSPAPSQSRSPEPTSRKGTAKSSRRGRKSRNDEDGEVYVVIPVLFDESLLLASSCLHLTDRELTSCVSQV